MQTDKGWGLEDMGMQEVIGWGGTDLEGFDTINGHGGKFMVMCRQPLQSGLLMIPNLYIQRRTSWEG